ncbi:MAG: MlaD family protein [Pseudomonadota bacterium]
MKNNLVEALIGAVVLVVAAWFTYFVYSRTDVGHGGGTTYVAYFNRIDGLNVGGDVRIGGVKVGSVLSQSLDVKRNYLARVEFTIDGAIAIPSDSLVGISSEGLLGGSYLNVKPGGMPELLAAGDEFEYTEDSIDLLGLVRQAMFAAGEDKGAPAGRQ